MSLEETREAAELLPCPFCGEALVLLGDYTHEAAWNWYGHANSDDSECLMGDFRIDTERDMQTPRPHEVKKWNTRAAATYSAALETERAERRKAEAKLARLEGFVNLLTTAMWGERGENQIAKVPFRNGTIQLSMRKGVNDSHLQCDSFLEAVHTYLNSLDHQNAAADGGGD